MAKSRFEVVLDGITAGAMNAILAVEIGNADRVWYLRGVHAGIEQARVAFRDLLKANDDRDDF